MEPFEQDPCWNVLDDYNTIHDFDVSEFYLTSLSTSTTAEIPLTSNISTEKDRKRLREQKQNCFQSESKACRERLRRGKLNERFSDLSEFLHPGEPAKGEKCSILADAVGTLHKLKSEHQVLKERKEKLEINTRCLKIEKDELRQEKLQLLKNKQKLQLRIKGLFEAPKGVIVSGYGGYPMWQWIPPALLDTSKDHIFRPPVA